MKDPMEIKFLALPNLSQLRFAAGELPEATRQLRLHRYELAQERIYHAQRIAAVIAVEIMRPHDYRPIHDEYRAKVREARHQLEESALAVFSEKCTKGL